MSFLDIFMLIVLVGSVVYGFRQGFIKQLGSIAGIIVGIILARIAGDGVGAIYGSMFPESFVESAAGQYAVGIMGRITVLVVVYCIIVLIARSLKFVTHTLLLGPIDRALGAVLAMVQWFLGLSVLLNAYAAMNADTVMSDHSQLAGGLAIEAVMNLAPLLLGSHHAPWLG